MVTARPITYIGIDPGKHGGIAIIHGERIVTKPTPTHYCDQLLWMRRTLDTFPGPYLVVIEQVQGYIGSQANKGGGFGNTGSSMFTFGETYGAMLMMLTCLRDICQLPLKFQTVPPNTWQRGLGVKARNRKGGESKPQFKARLAVLARHYFPQKDVTLPVADALLIAHYCRTKASW